MDKHYKVTMEISISQDMIDELYNKFYFKSKNPDPEEIERKIRDVIKNMFIFDVDNISATEI